MCDIYFNIEPKSSWEGNPVIGFYIEPLCLLYRLSFCVYSVHFIQAATFSAKSVVSFFRKEFRVSWTIHNINSHYKWIKSMT